MYDVRDFGAKPDGKTICTTSIQKAIDACAAGGGGTVLLAGGKFLSGTLMLKSRVTLQLDPGAVLLGSTDLKDYPDTIPSIRSYTDNYVKQSLLYGEDVDNVAIVGGGTLDGQGAAFEWDRARPYVNRPYLLRFIRCRNVRVEGVHLRNSAMWMQHYLACDRVALRGVTVWNHVNHNNDGLDIDGCRDVTVSDCVFDSDDDAITLKSTLDFPCRDVVITNCVARSHCNAIKMGTESNGGFINIAISNCAVAPSRAGKGIYGRERGISGISLEIVDGGTMDGVVISNVTIQGVSVPLFVRLGNRARPFASGQPKPPMGAMRNVMLSNITATQVSPIGCALAGLPSHPIENLTLSNVRLQFEGGGDRRLADRVIEEFPDKYPEATMFGDLPAYGLFCRHVKGLTLDHVSLETAKPDLRHALVCDDVEDLAIHGLNVKGTAGAAPLVRFTNVREAFVHGCRPLAPQGTFLALSGTACRGISLLGNDFSRTKQAVEKAADVPDGELTLR